MNSSQRRKRRKKRRKQVDPLKAKQRRHKAQVRALFARMGFERYGVEDIQFNFEGRSGELDDLFVYENIIIVCEYTVGKATTAHVLGKKVLFDKINDNPAAWIMEFSELHQPLNAYLKSKGYRAEESRVRVIYASTEG